MSGLPVYYVKVAYRVIHQQDVEWSEASRQHVSFYNKYDSSGRIIRHIKKQQNIDSNKRNIQSTLLVTFTGLRV